MMKWNRLIGTTAVASIAALGAHVQGQQGEGTTATTVACTVAAVQQKAPAGTTITSAKIVEAKDNQPRHCLVDGHVASPGNEVNVRDRPA